jgi:hypothetical protein
MAKNEVATKAEGNFNLVTLDGALAEAINEEMDGLGSVPFDRVKIPSGGGIAFELPGEDEDSTESATELIGVILWHHPVNAYWREKFSGGNEQPDCSSYDGKTGVDRETGECKRCDSCPYNQFGSDGAGKACKNVHRVYILREDNPVPLILSLPPTSLKYMRDYISKRILLKNMRCYHAVTKITLKKEKNAGGIVYSRAAFSFVSKLTPEQITAAEAMANSIKQLDHNVDIGDDDYNTAAPTQTPPTVSEDGFMNVPEGNDEDLPFN